MKIKASDDTVVVHFRCKYCGVIMPAIKLDGTDLYQLMISTAARETMQTCDNCEKGRRT